MMKLIIINLILAFFLFPQFNFAQSWEWQHPKPQGHDLSAVYFLDSETGWAYGDFGTIIHTNDGGQNWVLQDTPTENWIYLLYFKDKDHGWAYTFEGEVLYTEDKGANWTISGPVVMYVLDAHFFNADTGVIVGLDENGGQILRTEDGGINWDTTFTLPNRGIGRLSFVNDTIGWAGGEDGLIIYTENGGLDWVEQNSGTDLDLVNISFVDEQHGWVAGDQYLDQATESQIFYTSDGGMTWSQHSVLQDVEVTWMQFVNEDDGYLLGSVLIDFHGIHVISAIFQTIDGGTTWSRMDFGIDEFFYRGFIIGDQDIWLVGDNSRILHSNDSGTSWTNQIEILVGGILEDVQFLNLNEGWATGTNGLLHTINGGQDWQLVMTDTFTDYWTSLAFPDNQNGWVAGDIVIHTSNGGQDWEEKILPTPTYDNEVFFTSPTDGWIVGNSQFVLSTTNGGQDWEIHDFPGKHFKDLHFVDSQRGWVVGGNYIVSTIDGGQNWSTYDIADYPDLRSVYFLDSLNGWVLSFGGSGLYYRTQDGGQTWQENTISGAAFMVDVYFVSAHIGWVVGTGGNIWYTEDGGDSWTLQDAGTDLNLFDIHAVDEANAWAVGFNGAILKYTGIAPTSVAPVTLIDDIKVFPNPADNEINITVPGPYSRYVAEIRSYTGQLIKSFWVVSQNTIIPLDGIRTGVYILNLVDGEKQFSKKIIIVKE